MKYRFGAFVLDTDQCELRCAGDLVALEPKSYQVLSYLVEHRDRLVTQRELLAQAWPDVAVDRLAVVRCISSIRQAVGDSAEAQLTIRTRRGHGYRFVAEVTVEEAEGGASERACPACQRHNPSSARFCVACGVALGMKCSACNQLVAQPAKFCPACGEMLNQRPDDEALPPSLENKRPGTCLPHAEHKMVSICYGLALLEAGSTDALDRETLYDLQQKIGHLVTEAVRPYGGELYELDSHHVAVLFGATAAMEDHAQRAVFAALAILQDENHHASPQSMSTQVRLTWQLGVHSGLVVVDPSASALQRTLTVSGDVLNGAAALATQAGSERLLISEATSRWVKDSVQLEPAAPVSVSGLSSPLSVFRVMHQQATQPLWTARPIRRHTRFVGRATEIERLRYHLDLAFEGRGQIVSLVGEPGIGKTRLLAEFVGLERGRSMTCLMSSCHAYGQNTPYLPLTVLIRQQCALHDMSDPSALQGHLHSVLHAFNMATADNIASLCHLLGTPDADGPADAIVSQQNRQQTFAMLHQFFIRLSQQQPLVLVIDDLHWIDATSLDFFSELAGQMSGAHILLLVTARPGYQPFWPTTSYVTQLSLAGLTEEEGRDVVGSIDASRPLSISTRR